MASIPSITLNDGATIPQFGLGVWRVQQDDTADVVRTALEAGYRHIDTAQMYGNETGVGQGIRDAGVARENVWVTTKLAGADHGYEPARRALEASLRRLGTDHVDLYLIHWPGRDGDLDTGTACGSCSGTSRGSPSTRTRSRPRRPPTPASSGRCTSCSTATRIG